MSSLEKSFAQCRRVARTRARNFYYSFLLLPPKQQKAMCAVYAFMRYADDISDDPSPPESVRRAALDRWEQALRDALDGVYGDSAILPAFHKTTFDYRLPAEYFHELIEGVRSDLSPAAYETFADLYKYCYRVASTVGLITIRIFGYESPEALKLAEKCGVAFQLTNILRDVAEDARAGRVYLPREDLERFGLTREDLLAGRRGENFERLMEFEWERANRYYREAAPLLGMVRPQCRPALWAMMSIYYGVLKRIRGSNYDVFSKRVRLSAFEKAWIVARALVARKMGGVPPFPA